MNNSMTVPTAIILGGIIVALAVYFSIAKPTLAPTTAGNPALVRPVSSSDHILGNPTAPVIIVEYSDFDCAYCKSFNDILHQIVANEGTKGQVAWVFRQFPLTELHPNALKHAEATECAAKAGSNDAFWKFASALYANQPADPSRYGEFASLAGISGTAFTACYTNAANEVDEHIMADRQNALDTGAQGTPYSLILVKGRPPVVMDGAYTYDAVKLLIDDALAN